MWGTSNQCMRIWMIHPCSLTLWVKQMGGSEVSSVLPRSQPMIPGLLGSWGAPTLICCRGCGVGCCPLMFCPLVGVGACPAHVPSMVWELYDLHPCSGYLVVCRNAIRLCVPSLGHVGRLACGAFAQSYMFECPAWVTLAECLLGACPPPFEVCRNAITL